MEKFSPINDVLEDNGITGKSTHDSRPALLTEEQKVLIRQAIPTLFAEAQFNSKKFVETCSLDTDEYKIYLKEMKRINRDLDAVMTAVNRFYQSPNPYDPEQHSILLKRFLVTV